MSLSVQIKSCIHNSFSPFTNLCQLTKKTFLCCMSARNFSCTRLQFWKVFPICRRGVTLLPAHAPPGSCPPCCPRRRSSGGLRRHRQLLQPPLRQLMQPPLSCAKVAGCHANHPSAVSPAIGPTVTRRQSSTMNPAATSSSRRQVERRLRVRAPAKQKGLSKQSCEDTLALVWFIIISRPSDYVCAVPVLCMLW